ncbi:MAG: transposase family protein [Mycobacterium sp.]|nr:transposase family protein [Mycobacterium sp.]
MSTGTVPSGLANRCGTHRRPTGTRRPRRSSVPPVSQDPRCPGCGRDGRYRDTVTRAWADLPVAGDPLVWQVAIPRYRCTTVKCRRSVFCRIWASS